jgi:hypothetical protein
MTNRLEDQGLGDGIKEVFAQPSDMQLAQTGCVASLDTEGIIHILNGDGQQLFAVKAEHIPFELPPLLVTLNLWFMAFSNGRASMQDDVKNKALELLKLAL